MNGSMTSVLVPEVCGGEIENQESKATALSKELADKCLSFLRPLLIELDQQMDLRLVRTVANTITALIRHRNRSLALLLSELGAYLTGPEHAPAGTKRLANLVHSDHWQAEIVDNYLLTQGQRRVQQEAERVQERRALCMLDGSVLEKPESTALEGLSPIRSSKAKRLGRPRPKQGKGYYRGKPGGPIVVPGFHWLGVMVTGWALQVEHRPLAIGAWHWYAKPLPQVQTDAMPVVQEKADPVEQECFPRQREQEAAGELLERVVAAWGKERLLHVWDRGFCGAPWLGQVLDKGWCFVVRWKKGNRLRPVGARSLGDPQATAYRREQDGIKAWKLTAGLRAWGKEMVANPRNPKQPITVSFAARAVFLLNRDDPLWLVVVRLGKSTKRRRGSSEPWRLLTNLPVETKEQCWRVVEAYAARWQVEQMLRFGKSELGVESIRVRSWEARRKLLALATLAYAFLLELLASSTTTLLTAILRFAHRTGRQAHDAWRHLYRLRAALANLWQKHTPILEGFP